MNSFSYLEPVCCSMSSSNCCFLTCKLSEMGLSLPAPCRVAALLRKMGVDAPADVCTREDLEAFLVGRLKP